MKKHFVTLLSVMIITSALKMMKRKKQLIIDSYQNEREIKITVENPHKLVEEKGSGHPSF